MHPLPVPPRIAAASGWNTAARLSTACGAAARSAATAATRGSEDSAS